MSIAAQAPQKKMVTSVGPRAGAVNNRLGTTIHHRRTIPTIPAQLLPAPHTNAVYRSGSSPGLEDLKCLCKLFLSAVFGAQPALEPTTIVGVVGALGLMLLHRLLPLEGLDFAELACEGSVSRMDNLVVPQFGSTVANFLAGLQVAILVLHLNIAPELLGSCFMPFLMCQK